MFDNEKFPLNLIFTISNSVFNEIESILFLEKNGIIHIQNKGLGVQVQNALEFVLVHCTVRITVKCTPHCKVYYNLEEK